MADASIVMKSKGVFFAAVLTAVLCFSGNLSAYSGGTGDPNNPYQIANVTDLLTLSADANDYNKCFIMTADIDLDPNLPGNRVFTTAVIAPDVNNASWYFEGITFTGAFDGAGHKIINLTVDANGLESGYLGLFGDVNSGEIKNLGLENVSIIGGNESFYLGGLVGENWGTISNCFSKGAVTGGNGSGCLGGLVGYNHHNISDCFSTGNIVNEAPDSDMFGGLVGWNQGTISNCFSTSNVTGGGESNRCGGLVGHNEANISNCYSTGDVTGWGYAGGIAGSNGYHDDSSGTYEKGTINNCYSTSLVIGLGILGGLVGQNEYGSIGNSHSTGNVTGVNNSLDLGGLVGANYDNISNCYSTGAVSGGNGSQSLGGLVGDNGSGTINNCYSKGTVSGGRSLGGLVGINRTSISNCFSTGDVNSIDGLHNLGGLAGWSNGTFIGCFWDINTSGTMDGVGSMDPDPNGVAGKTTAEMKTLSNFTSAGWDFSYTDGDPADWFMPIDEYPILTWQISPADLYTDGKNNFRDWAIFAEYWLRKDCAIYNDYCEWADMNFDGHVDISDLADFVSYWLEEGIY